ncbi:MAG: outer membrane protein assembly factor BamA [Acidobacteria bacterium]|nr:outer membrane protein assembly factor BamA [Acidobacteriota bacterium]
MSKRSPIRGCLAFALAAGLGAQEAEPIARIEVVGAQKLSAETVIFKAGIKVGDDLRGIDFTSILERLWATGSFDDIKFEVEEGKEGRRLVIRVKERPVIKEVDYRGGTEIGVTTLKDKIKEKKLEIKPDSLYDPESARKIKALIVEQAAEKGFRNPVVDVTLESMGAGLARMVFEIKEGGKVRIYQVRFRGNKVFSSATLRRAMAKTRQHWMFSWLTSHDLLVDKNLEEDLQSVKKVYWREGYKDVFVGQPTIVVEDFTTPRQKVKNEKRIKEAKSPKYDLRATLEVPVLEGERFFDGKLLVTGNDKVFRGEEGEKFFRTKIAEAKRDNRSFIAKFLNLRPSIQDLPEAQNRPFDLDALNSGVEKVREAYSNLSYVAFRAEKKLDVREANGVKKVDVTLKVDEGEAHSIRRIEFEGNTNTKDKVLRRSMLVKEGDPFSLERFKDSFTGLGQLGFFDVKNQEPKIEPVPNKPQVDITIKGEEAGVNELLFQGGYGSVFGFSLGMSFSTKNLGGGGETLSFSYNAGKFQKYASIGFMEPYVLDLPYSFSANVANGSTDYDASRVGLANAYSQFTRSLGVGVGTRLSTFIPTSVAAFFTSVNLGYSYRIIRIQGGQNYYYRNSSSQLTSSMNMGITYSTVNHPFKPTNGTKLGFTLEYGGWQLGTDRPYMRSSWEFAKFSNLGERHIFGMNMSYGYLRNMGREELSLWEMFRPGGENTVRGYRFGQIGSVIPDPFRNQTFVIGGNKQFIANFEYQFKIADQFRAVMFYDAGNAWAPGVKTFSRDLVDYFVGSQHITYRNPTLVRSAGFEFRFFLPISPAPLRLIWARKLNPYPFDPEGKNDFQFSIGTTF